MDLQLTNKKALVTGSTAGIGFAVASLLAQEGAAVVVNGRSQRRVAQAVQRIRTERKNAQVTGIPADLGTKEGVNLLVRDVPVVDILVNNLGIFEPKPFSEITDEDWLRFFEVNVLSGARLSRFYLPQMLQKNWGRILFISSESGVNIPVEMVHYGVTKTAQIALARLALPWSCCRRCARRKRQRAASIARPHDASAADISSRVEIAAAWPPAL